MESDFKAVAKVTRMPAERRIPKLIQVRNFSRYTLVARLGRGGMAEVFLGYQSGPRGFRKPIVIKKILPDLAEDPRLVQMFFDEARLAARLHHPNVVQTIDVGEADDEYFLAMEYLEGQPLSVIIKRSRRRFGGVPPRIACRVLVETLEGLHYAHELRDFNGDPLGVVHRDVSPQNVFVTYGGAVKVLDFGVAKATTQVVETRTGAVKGKYAYMAPEQGRGSEVDRRADVWAAGVLLWESLMGKRLFKEKTEYATLKAVMELPIPPLEGFEEASLFQPVIDRSLVRDVSLRYADAMEMRDALLSILETHFARAGRTEMATFMKRIFGDVIEEHERTLGVAMNAEEGDEGITTFGKPIHSDSMVGESGSRNSWQDSNQLVADEFADGTVPTGPPSLSVGKESRGSSRKAWLLGLLVVAICGPLGAYLGSMPGSSEGTLVETEASEPEAPTPQEAPPEEENPNLGGEAQAVAEDSVEEAPPLPVERTEEQTELRDRPRVAPRVRDRERRVAAPSTEAMEASVEMQVPAVAMEPPRRPEAETPVRRGTLAVRTTPWCDVFANGRLVGRSPGRFSMRVGAYTLTLVNPEQNIRTQRRIVIRANETAVLTSRIE